MRSNPMSRLPPPLCDAGEDTREFDTGAVGIPGWAPNKTQRARFRHWQEKARLGRPKNGEGARVISLSVERSLLRRTDARARALGVSRARFVAEALQAALRKQVS